MESVETDAEVMRRSVTEPAAFGVIYERHGVTVRRYVIRRVGGYDGEDIAAEVFVRAFRARARYHPERATALPWLLGVANHVVGDHRRVERRRLAAIERALADASEPTVDASLGLTVELVHALRRLPASHRDTLLLLVWGELSRDEVAHALGVAVGTVNSRIARARKRLASELGPLRSAAASDLRLNGESNV